MKKEQVTPGMLVSTPREALSICKSQKRNPSFGKKEIPQKRDKLGHILTYSQAYTSYCFLRV